MKRKLLKVLLLFIMVVGLSACGNKNKLTDKDGNVKKNFEMNEVAVYKGVEYAVVNYSIDNENRLYVTLSVKNTNKEDAEYYFVGIFIDEDGETVNPNGEIKESPASDRSILKPNEQYYIVYSVPINNPKAKFDFRMVIDESSKAMKDNDGSLVEFNVKLN